MGFGRCKLASGCHRSFCFRTRGPLIPDTSLWIPAFLAPAAALALIAIAFWKRLRRGQTEFWSKGHYIGLIWMISGLSYLGGLATLLMVHLLSLENRVMEVSGQVQVALGLVLLPVFEVAKKRHNRKVTGRREASMADLVAELWSEERLAEAAALGRVALGRDSRDFSLAANTAGVLLELGQHDEAAAILEKLSPEQLTSEQSAFASDLKRSAARRPPTKPFPAGCLILGLLLLALSYSRDFQTSLRESSPVQFRSAVTFVAGLAIGVLVLVFAHLRSRFRRDGSVVESVRSRLRIAGRLDELAAMNAASQGGAQVALVDVGPLRIVRTRVEPETLARHRRRWQIMVVVGVTIAIAISVTITFWPEVFTGEHKQWFGAVLWLCLPVVATVAWLVSVFSRKRQP